MNIGKKLRNLRVQLGLTQEELASRSELSKGFISQVERDLTSPSIATLTDILECLGTNLNVFFREEPPEQIVFSKEEMFVKERLEEKSTITWLVPNCQKNQLEPILLDLAPGGQSHEQPPHEGEEFGYVLSGSITFYLGEQQYRLKKGDSFNVKPGKPHGIINRGKSAAKVLWVSTPPVF